jgi:nitroimidazol reductase NimA-like FMN-containing flavoprotein (pyridoxamine 5'-phosphate oxidase superfamily)
MLIEEMTREACLDFLVHPRLGRLACAWEGQPYIIPMYFARYSNRLYSCSTVGQKLEWMRLNPLVCVEADEIESTQQWYSVIVFGRFEELPKTPEYEDERRIAYSVLQRRPMWWEPAYVKTVLQGKERELNPIYFCVHIGQVSGRRAALAPEDTGRARSP